MADPDHDARLMQAFCAGDSSAFDALFSRWARPLLRYLRRLVGDPVAAEDLIQETFLRVHRARRRYVPEARFSSWLFTIATRLALNELQRPRRAADRAGAPADAGLALPAPDAPADEALHARRLGRSLEPALRALPERQRAALWLAAVEGLSYAEVAAALETTEKSVKALVHRARAALAAALPEARAELRSRAKGSP